MQWKKWCSFSNKTKLWNIFPWNWGWKRYRSNKPPSPKPSNRKFQCDTDQVCCLIKGTYLPVVTPGRSTALRSVQIHSFATKDNQKHGVPTLVQTKGMKPSRNWECEFQTWRMLIFFDEFQSLGNFDCCSVWKDMKVMFILFIFCDKENGLALLWHLLFYREIATLL